MTLHTNLLYHLLHEQYPLTRHGRHINQTQPLCLPVFYNRGTMLTAGAVYIARIQDLPDNCDTECVFICIGGRPASLNNRWRGEVFSVSEHGLDILSLFNTVIGFYDRVLQWDRTMQGLLENGAAIEEYVRISLPIFDNCISITDYNLRLLVNSDMEEVNGKRRIQISNEFERIPNAVSAAFQEDYLQYTERREPFTYKGQRENPEGENYCINLHLGNTYIGNCTLWEKMRPMRKSDFILFQEFAQYILKALSTATAFQAGNLTTMKNIFSELLRCFPVSMEEYNSARALMDMDMLRQGISFGCWHCVVIRSANRNKTLPEQYICASIEDMIPNTVALTQDKNIVCFSMVPDGEDCETTVCDILFPYLKDMNFRAGISSPIDDVFEAHSYYLQALSMLETGLRLSPKQYIYRFADYVLPYMLYNATGSFKPDIMFPKGLLELQENETGVDYWGTLRQYLDNECNASRTAQDLFLHRSSLLPRLDRIRSLVDMDTPEQRLYLRICIYLKEYMK